MRSANGAMLLACLTASMVSACKSDRSSSSATKSEAANAPQWGLTCQYGPSSEKPTDAGVLAGIISLNLKFEIISTLIDYFLNTGKSLARNGIALAIVEEARQLNAKEMLVFAKQVQVLLDALAKKDLANTAELEEALNQANILYGASGKLQLREFVGRAVAAVRQGTDAERRQLKSVLAALVLDPGFEDVAPVTDVRGVMDFSAGGCPKLTCNYVAGIPRLKYERVESNDVVTTLSARGLRKEAAMTWQFEPACPKGMRPKRNHDPDSSETYYCPTRPFAPADIAKLADANGTYFQFALTCREIATSYDKWNDSNAVEVRDWFNEAAFRRAEQSEPLTAKQQAGLDTICGYLGAFGDAARRFQLLHAYVAEQARQNPENTVSGYVKVNGECTAPDDLGSVDKPMPAFVPTAK